eukprot:Selendium_serpulae@DN6451_c1_g2_i5.p1
MTSHCRTVQRCVVFAGQGTNISPTVNKTLHDFSVSRQCCIVKGAAMTADSHRDGCHFTLHSCHFTGDVWHVTHLSIDPVCHCPTRGSGKMNRRHNHGGQSGALTVCL